MSTAMMSAPSCASRTAWLRPWPRAAPVMKATLPETRPISASFVAGKGGNAVVQVSLGFAGCGSGRRGRVGGICVGSVRDLCGICAGSVAGSVLRVAGVHGQRVRGDVAGLVGGEEQHRVADVLRLGGLDGQAGGEHAAEPR